ncbi:MAG: protein BatD [Archangiaceae bacterium]|nr:protein BatD [Archangiaceae bacterium]
MRRTGSHSALLLLGLLTAATARAEVEFYQTVDRTKIGTEDTFHLTIVVGDAPEGATVQFPAPNDFEVLQRSQSTQMSYSLGAGNSGVIKRVQKYTLTMRANRTGKLTIPPAALATAQKTLKTEPIQVEVVKGRLAPDAPPPGRRSPFPDPFGNFFGGGNDDSDPFSGFPQPPEPDVPRGSSDTFLKASLDKETAWVGEQVNFSLYIYSRADLAAVDAVTMPKLEGFLSEDLDSPTQLAPESRTIGGVPYRAYLLRRRAIFPLKAGDISIGPAEVDITTGWLYQGSRQHRKGNPLTLKVKPLPREAQGLNVGRWRINAEASQTSTQVGAPLQVRVVLDGVGNLKSAVMPKLSGPTALKIYEPTTTDKVQIRRGTFGGTRVQEYVVLPQQTGTFTLPAVKLRYFNPESGQVEESTTDPLTLTVAAGAGGQNYAQAPAGGSGGTDAAGPKNRLEAGGLKQLRHTAQFTSARKPLWSRPWFVPFAAGPLALTLGFAAFGLMRRATSGSDPASEKKKKARAARARLAAAEKLRASGKTADFYSEVEKALLSFLDTRLSQAASGLTREQLDLKMAAAGASEDVRARVKSALETCDVGRYAPGMGDDAARGRALDEAARAIEAWDDK